jgi:hypothetical protein
VSECFISETTQLISIKFGMVESIVEAVERNLISVYIVSTLQEAQMQ